MKCFADLEKECDILKVKKCRKCNFYKTQEQYEEGLKKYPPLVKEKEELNSIKRILKNKLTNEELEFSSLTQLSLFLGKSRNWACSNLKRKGNKFSYKKYEIEIRRLDDER